MSGQFIIVCILLLLTGCGSTSSPPESNIYIVRHGEKEPNNSAFESLINIGVMRSWALVPYLKYTLPIYGFISTIYAPPVEGSYTSTRPQETCLPLAYTKQMSLNLSFQTSQSRELGERLASESSSGNTIFICWEHTKIIDVVEGLGVPRDQIPHWKSGDFDTVYHIVLNSNGTVKTFEQFTQELPSLFTIDSVAFSENSFTPNAIAQLTSLERAQLNTSCHGASVNNTSTCSANWDLITCCDVLLYQDPTANSNCSQATCDILYGVTAP